jgi:PhzF family phenazine biosynthesis protein
MRLNIYQIDAFTSELFKGNPAAVVPLEYWLPDKVMQAIAIENNLSETAFFVRNPEGVFEIRWFSPIKEIDFCGHATLASAHVLFARDVRCTALTFWAKAVGELAVIKLDDGRIEMNFPEREPLPPGEVPDSLLEGLSIQPQEVLRNGQAYFAIYSSEEQVRSVVPLLHKLAELKPFDVVVCAPGDQHDIVSRYFWPANGGEEDPVTGSIHAGLAPLWAKRLRKTQLLACQLSRRTGVLHCRLEGGRVHVSGSSVQYLEGSIDIPEKYLA